MAVGLQTGVPWVMCKQPDAPDPVINACNGMNCGETFTGPNSPNKPAVWTENWTSFYQAFGEEPLIRSAEDIAFAVALWIAKNGSFVNYYMYHGGTNFARTGSAFVTTSYYDQAPLDEYGLIRQPKWGHLRELHIAIKQGAEPLLSGTPTNFSLGQQQDAYVFQGNLGCIAFLSNSDKRTAASVQFRNSTYELPQRSISILSDCKNVIFNTAKVNAQYGERSVSMIQNLDVKESWEEFMDGVPSFAQASFKTNALSDQIGVAKDDTDYLWYSISYDHATNDSGSKLHVYSRGHVVHAFVNGMHIGTAHGSHKNPITTLEAPISLIAGNNNISLLSVLVGLPDSGAFMERKVAGLRRVRIQHNNNRSEDISTNSWGYQIGLLGEQLGIYAQDGLEKVNWKSIGNPQQPLTWYKTLFDAPEGNDSVVLNLGSMGKGEAWINGENIGRYWISFNTPKGRPSQTLYHVPRSFLKPSGNLLVLFEEIGGDPLQISFGTPTISRICGSVSDEHLPPIWSLGKEGNSQPSVNLQCPSRRTISSIEFSSFGTPLGDCARYTTGSCHSVQSRSVAEEACLGKNRCSMTVSADKFGEDPCPGTSKSLLVVANCS
ncbi:Beta-galactosidase 16 [Acorus calamus]|uniref:beta-galactosidase n=1 Tax=Acorus calamus TaxID=4465 RepID=A0AAV9FC93_ACOCL|nr:Beta-galactosidase 16 [Acorus calamus]